MKKIAIIVFVLSIAGVLTAELLNLTWLLYASKPLIMGSLLIYYLASAEPLNRSMIVILAIIFSIAGDVLLLNDVFFLPGLISFLAAHLLYIFAYRQHQNEESENTLMGLQRVRLAFPVVLAGTGLVVVLYPVLGDFKIPVIIYSGILIFMVLSALFRLTRTSPSSFWMVFSGAVLFMISDSILAINKFLHSISFAGLWIMLIYSIGQFLIIRGLIKHPSDEQ